MQKKPYNNRSKWIDYQILRHSLKTNHILHNFFNHINDECPFCSANPDTIMHTMGTCVHTNTLWDKLKQILSQTYIGKDQTLKNKLFGYSELENTHPLNVIHSLTRLYIWNCRHKNTVPNIQALKNIVCTEIKDLKAIYAIKMRDFPYSQEWLYILGEMQPPTQ